MNISVNVAPVEIKVTVVEEPFGIKYDNVRVSNLAIRELQTIRELHGSESIAKQDKVLISKAISANTYYVYVSENVKGDPISIFIHYPDQDAELLTQFNVSMNRVEFLSFEDISGLYCTIKYLY